MIFRTLGVLLFHSLALANGSNPNCQPIRQGSVDVAVVRLHWEQVGGAYQLKNDVVCKTHANASVYQGTLGTCVYPVLAACPIELDGNGHKINVTGLIQLKDEPVTSSKHFILGYHVDRNSGTITTGEAGSADVFTFDPSISRMGVLLQSKLDGAVPGLALRDAVAVTAEFNDGP